METQEVTGKFILSAQSGGFKFDKDNEIERAANGIAQLDNPQTVYFEENLGDGKAKYWTDDISKAFVFTKLDDAVAMVIETNRSHSPVSIRSIISDE